MRKLLNTLYVTSPDAYLSLDGENVVVKKPDQDSMRLPLHNLENIVTFGYTGVSPALMGACVERNISLVFMTANGRFLARVVGESHGNVVLRKEQYRISDSEIRSLDVAKNLLTGKFYNSKWVIERAIRDYQERIDVKKLKDASLKLTDSLRGVGKCRTLEELRGLEGEAASRYFAVFDDLILQQKEDFKFENRNRRPPTDNVNALLSFVYTLLANEIAAALETVGLDAYVGFLHRDRPGRISLALDLMEEMRSVCVDRFVISLINKRMVNKNGFIKKENGAVFMDDDTRKNILKAWQLRKQEKIVHPFLNEKIEWGLVPYTQAMLLARFIRGDLDGYPVFLWK